ncbi:hypothetical protein ABZP36_027661 [Zizania latifolia]
MLMCVGCIDVRQACVPKYKETSKPHGDEILLFTVYFKAGLCFPCTDLRMLELIIGALFLHPKDGVYPEKMNAGR